MKALLLVMTLVLVTGSAFARTAGIGVCTSHDIYAEEMAKIQPQQKTDLKNAKGEIVGALEFLDATKKQTVSLFLCGNNSGYYYAEGDVSNWVSAVGQSIQVGNFYNDEYEVSATAETLKISNGVALLKVTTHIEFNGDREEADYPPFTDEFYLEVPQN